MTRLHRATAPPDQVRWRLSPTTLCELFFSSPACLTITPQRSISERTKAIHLSVGRHRQRLEARARASRSRTDFEVFETTFVISALSLSMIGRGVLPARTIR